MLPSPLQPQADQALPGLISMSVFGLATIPALLVITATAGMLLKPVWRHRINLVSGLVVIVYWAC